MTDTIREAAERLSETVNRRLKKWQTWFPHPQSMVEVPRDELLAVLSYSDAYLAEHPADDTLLITEGWLKDIGVLMLCPDLREMPEPDLVIGNGNSIGIIWWNNEWQIILSDAAGEMITLECGSFTRGYVRRLLKAMGVEIAK